MHQQRCARCDEPCDHCRSATWPGKLLMLLLGNVSPGASLCGSCAGFVSFAGTLLLILAIVIVVLVALIRLL